MTYTKLSCLKLEMVSLIEKPTSVSSSRRETASNFFTKPKSFGFVLSLRSDHIQGNTVEKDFQILIKLNFIYCYTIVRGKD